MSLFSAFETDKEKTVKGTPVQIPQAKYDDGTLPVFYLARMSETNPEYQRTLEAKTRPFKRKIETDTITESEAHELNVDIFCTAILKNWDNVRGKDGKDIPFSVGKAKDLMNALPDLHKILVAEARNIENFKKQELEEELKN